MVFEYKKNKMLKLFVQFCTLVAILCLVVQAVEEGVDSNISFDFVFPKLNESELESKASPRSYLGNKLYAVAAFTRVNWFSAQQICSFRDMTLATITTAAENENLKRYLHDNGLLSNGENYWIGGTDLASQGKWLWFNIGRPLTYKNWRLGEPNNLHGKEHCLNFNDDGTWNDLDCYDKSYFICENRCPLNSYEVPTYTSK